MKKTLLLIIALGLFIVGSAQVSSPVIQMKGHVHAITGDTITNTGTVYDSIALNLSYSCATIEVQCTKISGTLGGTLKLQVCNKTGLSTVPNWTTLQDTATVTNTAGSKSYFFQLPGIQSKANDGIFTWPVPPFLPYYCYRILWTGTGTMSGSMKSYFVGRHL